MALNNDGCLQITGSLDELQRAWVQRHHKAIIESLACDGKGEAFLPGKHDKTAARAGQLL